LSPEVPFLSSCLWLLVREDCYFVEVHVINVGVFLSRDLKQVQTYADSIHECMIRCNDDLSKNPHFSRCIFTKIFSRDLYRFGPLPILTYRKSYPRARRPERGIYFSPCLDTLGGSRVIVKMCRGEGCPRGLAIFLASPLPSLVFLPMWFMLFRLEVHKLVSGGALFSKKPFCLQVLAYFITPFGHLSDGFDSL